MFIEHATGIYLAYLLVALVVAILTSRYSGLPYTISLTIVGFVIGLLRLTEGPEHAGFSKPLVFFVLLPPLLFYGALHLELNRLLRHFWPIFIFSILGVAISTAVIGGIMYWAGAFTTVLSALLFGAMMSPTDPVSVIAVFKSAGVSRDLRHLVEGESLFNDGTSIVLFAVVLSLIEKGGSPDLPGAVISFAKVAGGGLLLGLGTGYVTYHFLKAVDDHLIETAACLGLAMGSFWLAEIFHLSGVIATVGAGLLIGNHEKHLSMTPRGTQAADNFFEVVEFLINSILFLMIGLEMQVIPTEKWGELLPFLGVGVAAMLIARALVVYPSWRLLNLAGRHRPPKWSHVLFWGGLRGSIPIALMLGLGLTAEVSDPGALEEPFRTIYPLRHMILVAGFGMVMFSLVVQGLTMKPLLRLLGVKGDPEISEDTRW